MTDVGRKSRAARSPKWPALAKRLLKGKVCAVCGRAENLVLHHILPFHLFPALELDETNLIPLCESRSVNHHLLFGHLLSWAAWNVDVRADAAVWSQKIANRPKDVA